MEYLFYNGKFQNKGNVEITDRGFLYGDGFFETMHFYNNQVKFLSDHLDRIKDACSTLNLSFPEEINAERVQKVVQKLCSRTGLKEARVKLIIWRQEGGLFSPNNNVSNHLISVAQFNSSPDIKENVGIAETVYNQHSPFSKFKTLSSIKYVAAGIEKNQNNFSDIIILDHLANVSECLTSNIFWIKDNVVFTPLLETGCIEGILRKNILLAGKHLSIQIETGKYNINDLLSADMVFTSNIAGISYIKSIKEVSFKTSSDLLCKIKKELLF